MRSFFYRVPNGTLHIAEYGDPKGQVLLFFHGFPGSSAQGVFLHKLAKEKKIRILAPDRPGYGLSEFPKNLTLEEFALIVAEFIKSKDLKNIIIVGVSGGNPSAIATAAIAGDRVTVLGSISGLASYQKYPETFFPFHIRGLSLVERLPSRALKVILNAGNFFLNEKIAIHSLLERVGSPDKELLSNPAITENLISSMKHARLQGMVGVLFDLKSFVSPWHEHLKKIKIPYLLWHGEKDRILSVKMSEKMASLVPHSRLIKLPEEGHYSLPIERIDFILDALTKASVR